MSGGWWWPGFLIQLAIFLALAMGLTWALTKWTIGLMDERIHEHEHHDHHPPEPDDGGDE